VLLQAVRKELLLLAPGIASFQVHLAPGIRDRGGAR